MQRQTEHAIMQVLRLSQGIMFRARRTGRVSVEDIAQLKTQCDTVLRARVSEPIDADDIDVTDLIPAPTA